jgi:hypothetical protein
MSYNEWKHGLISDEEYAMEFELDDIRATRFETVEDQEEDEESEDCEGE